jgi:hypothetical protein
MPNYGQATDLASNKIVYALKERKIDAQRYAEKNASGECWKPVSPFHEFQRKSKARKRRFLF